MNRRTLVTALATVVAAGIAAPAEAGACTPQRIALEGLPGGAGADVLAFGPRHLVGGTAIAASGDQRAVLWHGGRIHDLGYRRAYVADISGRGEILINAELDWRAFTSRGVVRGPGGRQWRLPGLGGDFVWVRRMNNRREVAGSATTADGIEHPVVWRRGRPVDLGIPAGYLGAYAKGINQRGDVVGAAYTDHTSTPWRWNRDGSSGALDPGFAERAGAGEANVVDDHGRAAGVSGPLAGDQPFGEATLWLGEARRGLGTFPGGDYASILATNNQGDFVGTGNQSPGGTNDRVLLTDGERLLTMPALSGRIGGVSSAHAVTRRRGGDVTVGGSSENAAGASTATLWRCAYAQAVPATAGRPAGEARPLALQGPDVRESHRGRQE